MKNNKFNYRRKLPKPHIPGPFSHIRKPRTTGMDICSCFAFNCDPFAMSHAFNAKVSRRREQNVCVSCGNNPCKCKSNLYCSIKKPKD